ncbi:MAG: response regulator [Oscillatoriophycideae cyanobacterium NC_groundwater_1537_Pr4_S-0.65um_50_18]|nr:response regulator [Oscillatoriophycideae cyanobacterium NC_groundwater_1537_Pr4_S-0.65um_50_18]
MLNQPKVNILLVDDHPENLVALTAILEQLGQNLVTAKSGMEALKCLLEQDFAVILLDVQMPQMDGFETATLIRQRQRSHNTPIIFLTAFNTSDDFVFRGYSLKAVDYLFKPIEPETLLSKVEVFVELYQKTEILKQQTAQLMAANEQLKRSEEQFRSLSACSPIGIFLTDLEGRFTYTNPRCQAICGFSLAESLDKGWTNFIHPDDRERVLAQVSTEWGNLDHCHQASVIEYRFQPQAKVTRWVSVRSAPMISDKGELIGHVGTIEDITERKQAQEAQFQLIREQAARQEAETLNRMKDEFLAVLSHELRTPLNSILGWAKLLRSRSLEPEKIARALETIERNAELQAALIADILDVSQIIQGKLQLNCAALSLVPIVEAALDTATPLAAARTIQIQADLDPAIEPVWADAMRMQQIVGNLLSNAIKFTPPGGKVELSLRQVGAQVQMQVTDTGIGIPIDFLPYIFDRFRQADSSRTRGQGGLGLGLAIVHHLVTLHQGTVTATSPGKGQGATFTLELPTLPTPTLPLPTSEPPPTSEHPTDSKPPTAKNPTAPAPSGIRPLTGLQVLVVEDQPDAREFLQLLLEQAGAIVTGVGSAQAALSAIAELSPHILVSDIGMIEEDGYSLIYQVRRSEQGKNLPAIALTAYTGEADQARTLAAGFQTHLSKPFDPGDLVAAIVRLTKP